MGYSEGGQPPNNSKRGTTSRVREYRQTKRREKCTGAPFATNATLRVPLLRFAFLFRELQP